MEKKSSIDESIEALSTIIESSSSRQVTQSDSIVETTTTRNPIVTIIAKKPSEERDDDNDDVFVEAAFLGTPRDLWRRRRQSSDDALTRDSSPEMRLRSINDDGVEEEEEEEYAGGEVDETMKVLSSRWRLRSRRRAMMLKALSADCNNEDLLLPSLEESEADENETGDRKSIILRTISVHESR